MIKPIIISLPLTSDEARRLSNMLADLQAHAVRESSQLVSARRAPNAVELLNAAATLCADLRERLAV